MLSLFQLDHNGIFKDPHTYTLNSNIIFCPDDVHALPIKQPWSDRIGEGRTETRTLILFSADASGAAAVEKRIEDGVL